jgi:hypothetical protein
MKEFSFSTTPFIRDIDLHERHGCLASTQTNRQIRIVRAQASPEILVTHDRHRMALHRPDIDGATVAVKTLFQLEPLLFALEGDLLDVRHGGAVPGNRR